ncbi:glutamine cyclotransferase [Formosa agariphila KMM 3901]|uniref:Glutamine cyclotransferase n=1 Tax=Formosa agariphila (strain DSM 15362 / KCTC 12365 / LMG 23005 / KMM 3901 / M-2Alg 35-1) TaxID=1347342 RepID=T2KIW8_FORAG|nr:glutaminyl-peptide cyclotransferase [Formosa agariphila]CDF78817.1 glutamine cyclotransferase [Formosa agariphila KMM 3901]
MKASNILTVIFLTATLFSCGSSSNDKKSDFSLQTNAPGNGISLHKDLKLSIKNPKNLQIDSVAYFINDVKISENTDLSTHKLGKQIITAKVYTNGESQTTTTPLLILNDENPKVYTYELLNTYPHDITSYTQGLEFHNNIMYESTGQYKESKLRKIDYETGEVLQNVKLADEYFGEGLTILNDKLYQLTWQKGTGFVYDVNTLEKKSSFKYNNSKEGWGICNDGKVLYKSDGTEKIWILDPETLEEKSYIQVYTNKGKIGRVNELEWIDGKIYANIYQKDGVAIINPKNGAVEGVIDFTPLKKKVTQHQGLDVLNGMAFNHTTKTLFVTGKRWDKLFEVNVKLKK